ncbi:MAG: PEP-CTERM sorting domain-containing protein [Bryobacterales bacterium]|nr:PEP-CTERM sorting domain-containing protein [Bryobacterales bacterium]
MRYPVRRLLLLALLSCILMPQLHGAPITFVFTGSIHIVTDQFNLLSGRVMAYRDTVSGSFTYDTADVFGVWYTTPPAGLWMNVSTPSGQLSFAHDFARGDLLVAGYDASPGDVLTVLGRGSSATWPSVPIISNTASFGFSLVSDAAHSFLTGNHLPQYLDLANTSDGYEPFSPGQSWIGSGSQYPFLWQIEFVVTEVNAIPEPGSLFLIGLGLTALAGLSRLRTG